MLIVDGHEDPAYNTLVDGRDYLRSALAIRADEAGGSVPEGNGIAMLGLPEWLRGRGAIVVATLTAIPRADAKPGELGYPNAEAAYQTALAQLGIYRQWAAHPRMELITETPQLDHLLEDWAEDAPSEARRVGLVLLIENADVIREPAELGFWHEQGVRLVGPAWAANRYTGSTMDGGPLTALGRELLAGMDALRMALDLSHMSDRAIAEALDVFGGTVIASHANPRALVPMQRNLSDETIRQVAARNGVVGIMPLNWALDSTRPGRRTVTSAASRSTPSSTRSTTSASSPAARTTPGSVATSTEGRGPSARPRGSTPSPTCPGWRTGSAPAATATGRSPRSWAATGCGSCGVRCRDSVGMSVLHSARLALPQREAAA